MHCSNRSDAGAEQPAVSEVIPMAKHIDQVIDETESTVDEQRTVNVTHSETRGAVGVPVFLSAADLEQQGIDPSDIDEIAVRVENGFVLFEPVDRD